MFICKNCFKQISPHQPSFSYPILQRIKKYPKRPGVNAYIDADGKKKIKDDPGGIGKETVKEIRVCKHCYDKLTSVNRPTIE